MAKPKSPAKPKPPDKKSAPIIQVTRDGPYLVSGALPLQKETIVPEKGGYPYKWKKGEKYPKKKAYALCRCGQSTNKPYCTGRHSESGFDGTETASKKKYLSMAEKTKGPTLTLTDAVSLCASARFCERGRGTWDYAENSGDRTCRKEAIREACDCPSGRLVVWDRKTGKAIEPKFPKSISVTEDPQVRASGPLWVKGGIQIISADGKKYETRNRVTLCRCGKSANKPFCDSTHILIHFNYGGKRLKK